jgi:predicted nucleic acid-binding protein
MNDVFLLDNYIWISYLLNRQVHFLTEKILAGKIEVITCMELVEEIRGVLIRSKFSKFVRFVSIYSPGKKSISDGWY